MKIYSVSLFAMAASMGVFSCVGGGGNESVDNAGQDVTSLGVNRSEAKATTAPAPTATTTTTAAPAPAPVVCKSIGITGADRCSTGCVDDPAIKQRAIDGQKAASALFSYVFLGGNVAPASLNVKTKADVLKAYVNAGDIVATTASATAPVCTIKVSYYTVLCKDSAGAMTSPACGMNSNADAQCTQSEPNYYNYVPCVNKYRAAMNDIVAALPLEQRDFFANTTYECVGLQAYEMYVFDPSTARLTSNLAGGTGSSASAILGSDGSATNVRKWPATMTYCSTNCPLAGDICSTGDLATGQDAIQHIVVSGSYRKCQ